MTPQPTRLNSDCVIPQDEELTRVLAEAVFAGKDMTWDMSRRYVLVSNNDSMGTFHYFSPLCNGNDILMLIEAMAERHKVFIGVERVNNEHGGPKYYIRADIESLAYSNCPTEVGDDPKRAVCNAAYKALQVKP